MYMLCERCALHFPRCTCGATHSLSRTAAWKPIEVFNRVLGEIAEETLFSIPGGPTVKAVVKFMGEREMREVGN